MNKAQPAREYTDPSHLLKEMQDVAFDRALPGEVTTRVAELMSYIALAMIAVQLKRIADTLDSVTGEDFIRHAKKEW